MNYHILEANYLSGHRVRLRFRDGLSGEVDLRDALVGPVLEPLRNESEFRRFQLHELFHTLVWPNGADLAPEYLYEKVAAMNRGQARPA